VKTASVGRADQFTGRGKAAVERVGRQLERVGPCERARLYGSAGEIGRIGERAHHDGITRDRLKRLKAAPPRP